MCGTKNVKERALNERARNYYLLTESIPVKEDEKRRKRSKKLFFWRSLTPEE